MKLRIATCSLAVSAAVAALAPTSAVAALEAPTSGTLNIWFKAPVSNSTVSGLVQLDKCYVRGTGVSRVEFFLDSTRLNTDSTMSDGMSCVLDTTKFANGTRKLRAVAYNSSGASYTETTSINIQNAASGGSDGGTSTPTTPTAPTAPTAPSANGLTITSPQAGATLSGSTNPCVATPPKGTNFVRFYRDGVWLNTDTSSPYGCNINVSGLSNGTHKLKAISYGAGNVMTAQTEISVNVGTASGGTGSPTNAAPTVSLTAPAVNAVLSKTATCAASAADTDGSVSKVEFLLGSAVVGNDTGAPYSCSFDTTKYQNGTYTFTARATDNLGKISTVSRSVAVKNDIIVDDPGTGGGSASAISSADIVNQAQAEVPFSQQSGFNTQALAQYLQAPQIPETGMHAFTLRSGETLRLGKHVDPRNSSRKALAFQLDPKDVTTSGSKRVEIKFPNNIEMNRVYWTAMSVYVYDWGTLSTSDDSLFGLQQHNGSPADLSPNFALITAGNGRTFQVMALGSTSSSPTYGNTVTKKYAELPIPFGRWADFVFKFKLNTSGSGFLQVWMDGTLIADHKGLLGYITPGYKDFFKFGYYNWSGSNFASTRKVLLRSPVVVADPTGSKYKPEDLRAYVNAH